MWRDAFRTRNVLRSVMIIILSSKKLRGVFTYLDPIYLSDVTLLWHSIVSCVNCLSPSTYVYRWYFYCMKPCPSPNSWVWAVLAIYAQGSLIKRTFVDANFSRHGKNCGQTYTEFEDAPASLKSMEIVICLLCDTCANVERRLLFSDLLTAFGRKQNTRSQIQENLSSRMIQ